jgi:hypothetical protein
VDKPVTGFEIATLRCYQTCGALQLLALVQHDAMPMVLAENFIAMSLPQYLVGNQYNIEASNVKVHIIHFGIAYTYTNRSIIGPNLRFRLRIRT